ncbi:MAG TPA: MFS transporter [Candidatus Merdenecus merdavium]|nr:MFS transporter [Candidatus Merdenecus merdavium]
MSGKEVKTRKDKPGRIGIGKFWAWQTRGVSAAINFIVLSYLMIYCTDTMGMSPALVGTLLMASKLFDGVTDILAGFIIDRTKTRFGKGRPYEFAIIGAWVATWLMFSMPGEASMVVKGAWVFITYTAVQGICITLLSACQNVFMVRAFPEEEQRVKLASLGGIIIMLGSISMSISFPILMGKFATSPGGWSTLVLSIAVPFAIIGILRFVFVKEVADTEVKEERASLKDVGLLLRKNPYVYMVCFQWCVYSLVTGMGVAQYFYQWVTGNINNMGTANAMGIVVVPLLFFFPMLMKKIAMGKMIIFGCIAYIASGLIMFVSGGNMSIVIIGVICMGIGSLPMTYLTDLLMIDCGSYNEYRGYKRMDGTIGAMKGFVGKIGSAAGTGLLGIMLEQAGYNGSISVQPDSALLVIRIAMGIVPAVLFSIVAIVFLFYKLDKIMPEVNKVREEKLAGVKEE